MKVNDAQIVPIKGAQIFYLDKEHLTQNLNVTLISQNGSFVKVNHLQLAIFNRLLLNENFEDEPTVITTNLDINDLSMVANFITEGILPLPQETLKRHVPENINSIFQSFGIFLDQVLNNNGESLLLPSIHVKTELNILNVEDVKKELLEHDVKPEESNLIHDILDNHDFFDDEDLPLLPIKEVKKKRGRPRKIKHSDSEDDDWNPKLKTKKNRQITKKSLLDEIPAEIKPKRKYVKKNPTNLSRHERDLKSQCEKFLEDYKDFANLCIPDESKPETKAFETYHLPSDIATYKMAPRKIEKINTVQDHLHPYPCPECPAWINNQYALKNHQLIYHNEHYQCSFCKNVWPLDQPDDFKLHMFRHESRKHECIHCGFNQSTLKLLESHFKTEGPFHNNKCTQCLSRFTSNAEYRQHVESSHFGQWLYICGICEKTYTELAQLKEHRTSEHKITKTKSTKTGQSNGGGGGGLKMCDLCGKNVSSLASHHKIHHEEDLQKCPECPKICKTKYHLDDHIKGTHTRIPCEHCGLMIPIRRKERHIQQAHVNPEDRKYKCDHCGKGFTDRQKLNDHINTHTGERPYICKYCGKGFANHGNQRAHIRQAHLGQKRNYRK